MGDLTWLHGRTCHRCGELGNGLDQNPLWRWVGLVDDRAVRIEGRPAVPADNVLRGSVRGARVARPMGGTTARQRLTKRSSSDESGFLSGLELDVASM